MSSWIVVNLPWSPPPFHEPDPPDLTEKIKALLGGLTFHELVNQISRKNAALWEQAKKSPAEGARFSDLSPEVVDQIQANSQELARARRAIESLPESIEHQEILAQLRREHAKTHFSSQVEVGMLLELQDGTRILVGGLVGDQNQNSWDLGEIDISNETIVRYRKLNLGD